MSKITESVESSSASWATLETFDRTQVQHCLQRVLEEEVDQLLGRGKRAPRAVETPGG